jgi:CheY-specific phosphatase CheX
MSFHQNGENRTTDANLINIFLRALNGTLNSVCGVDGQKGDLSLVTPGVIDGHLLIAIHFFGDIEGTAVMQFNTESTHRFASACLMGLPVDALDEMTRNSLHELALRVAESARADLNSNGSTVGVSHDVYFNDVLCFANPLQFIRLPYNTSIGGFTLYINLYRPK